MLPLDTSIGRKVTAPSILDTKSINEEEDEFVYEKLTEINKRKDQAVM
jgi:hypothetical protein